MVSGLGRKIEVTQEVVKPWGTVSFTLSREPSQNDFRLLGKPRASNVLFCVASKKIGVLHGDQAAWSWWSTWIRRVVVCFDFRNLNVEALLFGLSWTFLCLVFF